MKEKILFIDDEQANLDGFYYSFHNEFDITTALSAIEALEILKRNKFKVIISDHRMRGMTGIELFSKYKNQFNGAILIVLTAFSESDDLINAINNADIYRYILKPWDTKDLKITIKSAIQTFDLQLKNKKLISELQTKNTRLKKALEKANESDQIKLSFINNISHEIRTPMNGILGFSDLLKSKQLPKQFKNHVEIIQKSTQQLLNIIEGVLEFSILLNEDFKIEPVHFEINSLINELKKDFADRINSDIEYIIKPTDKRIKIYSDQKKIKRALTKILDNAFRYTKQGFVELGIDNTNEKKVVFYIKDTGVGIPDDIKDKIYDTFTKMDIINDKYNYGNGLGLSIAKIITQKMNGEIWFESEKGKQTVFYCMFPLNCENPL